MILKWTSFLKISGKILGFDFWFVFSFGPSRRTRVRKIINHFFIFSVSMFVLYVIHFSVCAVVLIVMVWCFYIFSVSMFVLYVLHFFCLCCCYDIVLFLFLFLCLSCRFSIFLSVLLLWCFHFFLFLCLSCIGSICLSMLLYFNFKYLLFQSMHDTIKKY